MNNIEQHPDYQRYEELWLELFKFRKLSTGVIFQKDEELTAIKDILLSCFGQTAVDHAGRIIAQKYIDQRGVCNVV